MFTQKFVHTYPEIQKAMIFEPCEYIAYAKNKNTFKKRVNTNVQCLHKNLYTHILCVFIC